MLPVAIEDVQGEDIGIQRQPEQFAPQLLRCPHPLRCTKVIAHVRELIEHGLIVTGEDELEGEDFVCPAGVEVHNTCPSGGACASMCIYYRYDSGWAKGLVERSVEHSDTRSLNGLYAAGYDDGEVFNDLGPG